MAFRAFAMLTTCLALPLAAQTWGPCGSGICAPANTSVGIGTTTTPGARLDVQSPNSGFTADFMSSNGSLAQGLFVGTSLTAPYVTTLNSSGSTIGEFSFATASYEMMHMKFNLISIPAGVSLQAATNAASWGNGIHISALPSPASDTPSFPWGITFDTLNYFTAQILAQDSEGAAGTGDLVFKTAPNASGPQERMRITGAGNVGIGLQNPIYPLSVKGTIGAGEVMVTSTSGWSDSVFAPEYRLAPLSEVADYVKANRHLPEIPSAAEVAEKGVGVGDMQAKLLAKIEELTLHMIAADERVRELEREVDSLRKGTGTPK